MSSKYIPKNRLQREHEMLEQKRSAAEQQVLVAQMVQEQILQNTPEPKQEIILVGPSMEETKRMVRNHAFFMMGRHIGKTRMMIALAEESEKKKLDLSSIRSYIFLTEVGKGIGKSQVK